MSDSPYPVPPPQSTGGSGRWEPPTPEQLQELLPQYQVHMLIGRGGMGAVYKATQLSLDREVAIKLLPPAIEQQDLAFAERFKNEARLMGRMNHPAIVSVYDFGSTVDGQLYFVMEFVDGTDVQRMIAREGKLPPEHALAITVHLCDALGYAHKQGIVHRDIKPSNVLIDMEGRIKVADFGLAKLSDKNLNFGLTQTGVALGTPDYVAPESLMPGSDVDGRADIYAVGVMLYQMLTGDIPRGMFRMPSQKFQSIDPRFDAIIRRALEHDREERYQSSLELRMDLDVILTTPRAEPVQESSAALPQQPPHGHAVESSSSNPDSSQQQRIAPKRVPYEPPPEVASSSTLPYLFAILLLLGIGAWLILKNQPPATPSNPPGNTETAKVTPQPSPAPKIATNSGSKPPPPTPPEPPPPVKPTHVHTTPPAKVPSTPAPPATTHESIQSRLSQLEAQFQSALERDVIAPYTEQLFTLGAGYLTALERAIQDASKAARLDEALALREEKQRFTTQKSMPPIDPADLPKSLVNLRNTYRSTEKKYTQQKDAAALPLYDRYIAVLSTLEQEVQGHSTDAAAVRTKREDVIARRKQSVAKLSSGA